MAEGLCNTPALNSAMYQGHVMHHRMSPTKHRFIYRVFSCCFDLDELPTLDRLKLFSVNRFNLFSFHERDHGMGQGSQDQNALALHIRSLLEARGFKHAGHKIKLLCYPRILGYAFNPLSVYFCYNSAGALEVILYEVSNTFGSRHTYLLEANEAGDSAGEDQQNPQLVRHSCHKAMYVSPFMPMDTAYHFRIQPPTEKVAVNIRQTTVGHDQTKSTAILHATFTGKHTEFSDKHLLKAFIKYPLMTLKVIGGIHWEALKLWRKKLAIQPRDKTVTQSISWQDKTGITQHESL